MRPTVMSTSRSNEKRRSSVSSVARMSARVASISRSMTCGSRSSISRVSRASRISLPWRATSSKLRPLSVSLVLMLADSLDHFGVLAKSRSRAPRRNSRRLELASPRCEHDEADQRDHTADDQRSEPRLHDVAQPVDGGEQQKDDADQCDGAADRDADGRRLEVTDRSRGFGLE